MAGGVFSEALLFGMTIRESANDGSDFTNPAADYRRLFLGEDGLLHLKDSAGTVTDIGAGGSVATDAIWDAKGDLAGGTGANTAARLAVAANGSSLRANSGATTGLEWQLNNLAASAAPTVNEDSGDGYSVGSRWIDTTADKEYVCLDATVGAAVWTETTQAGGASTHVGAKVYKTVQTLTDTVLAFDNELWDSDGFHDNSTQNSRLTVPSGKAGKYHVTASCFVSGTTRLEIYVNGSVTTGRGTAGAVNNNYAACVGDVNLSVGDYVEIMGNAGVSRTYGDAGNAGDYCVFSMFRTGT